MQARLAMNQKKANRLCLPGAEIKGVSHHNQHQEVFAWLGFFGGRGRQDRVSRCYPDCPQDLFASGVLGLKVGLLPPTYPATSILTFLLNCSLQSCFSLPSAINLVGLLFHFNLATCGQQLLQQILYRSREIIFRTFNSANALLACDS